MALSKIPAEMHGTVNADGGQRSLLFVPWSGFSEARYLYGFGAIDRFDGHMLALTSGMKF